MSHVCQLLTLLTARACAVLLQTDVLVILDRSASIWESKDANGVRDWLTTLSFFQGLLEDEDIKVSEDEMHFALATFSEDYVIHFGFNTSYNKQDLAKAVQYNNPEPGAETWIPHDVVGGKELKFGQTNYGLVVDILRDAYENREHGARPDAVPRVFLITDGSMDDQCSAIYRDNNCPATGDYTCGFDKRNDASVAPELCKTCWRDQLSRRLSRTKVGKLKDTVNVIGIGNPDSPMNKPDDRTLLVFTHGNTDHVIQYPDYQDLLDFAKPRVKSLIKSQSCRPPSAASPTTAGPAILPQVGYRYTDNDDIPETTAPTSGPQTTASLCSDKDDSVVCKLIGAGHCDVATAQYPRIVPKVRFTCPGMCNSCSSRTQERTNLDAVLTEDEIELLSLALSTRDCAADKSCRLCDGQGSLSVPHLVCAPALPLPRVELFRPACFSRKPSWPRGGLSYRMYGQLCTRCSLLLLACVKAERPCCCRCGPCAVVSKGRCQRCQGSAYLLDGRCMQRAGACAAAGLVAVGGPGDSAYGRACVAAGGVCRFEAQHSCRSPKALGDCVASRITAHNATCLACHNASWLVNGEFACTPGVLCCRHGGRGRKGGGLFCSCHHAHKRRRHAGESARTRARITCDANAVFVCRACSA